MKCSTCGANIEVTEFEDGTLLIRQDCQCKIAVDETKLRNNSEEKENVDM